MTIEDFIRLADDAEARGLERFYVTVVGREPSGCRPTMQIMPGLLGEVCCVPTTGGTTVLVRISDARSWLKRRGYPTTLGARR